MNSPSIYDTNGYKRFYDTYWYYRIEGMVCRIVNNNLCVSQTHSMNIYVELDMKDHADPTAVNTPSIDLIRKHATAQGIQELYPAMLFSDTVKLMALTLRLMEMFKPIDPDDHEWYQWRKSQIWYRIYPGKHKTLELQYREFKMINLYPSSRTETKIYTASHINNVPEVYYHAAGINPFGDKENDIHYLMNEFMFIQMNRIKRFFHNA